MNIKQVSFAVIAGLALATSSAASADNHSKAEKMVEKKMEVRSENSFDAIALSDEQKLSVQAIKDKYQPQLDALYESKKALIDQKSALDPNSADYAEQSQVIDTQIQEVKAEKKMIKEQMREETLAVLTPEQRSSMGKWNSET